MKLILTLVMSVLLLREAPASEAQASNTTFIAGVPAKMTSETGTMIWSGIDRFVREAKPGDVLELVDAYDLKGAVISLTIPDAHEARRFVILKDHLKAAMAFLQARVGPSEELSGHVLLPQFSRMAARRVGRLPRTRLIVWGRAHYRRAGDEAFWFAGDRYPGDRYVLASSEISPFGTEDRHDLLKGVSVHWTVLNDWSSSREESALRRLWARYFEAQGGQMGSFSGSSTDVIAEALAERVVPVPAGEPLNEAESDFVMYSFAKARPLPASAPATPPKVVRPKVRLVVAQDGSVSQSDEIKNGTRPWLVGLLEDDASEAFDLELGVSVFRASDNSHSSGLQVLPEQTEVLRAFLNGGEGRLSPDAAYVDPIYGLEQALSMMGSPAAEIVPVLVLISDVGLAERATEHEGNGEASERVLRSLRTFFTAHPQGCVIAVRTPGSKDPGAETFFRDVVDTAGPGRGVFLEDVAKVSEAFWALLAKAGVRS